MGPCREIRQYTIYSDSQTITEHKKTNVFWANLRCRGTRIFAYDWRKIFSMRAIKAHWQVNYTHTDNMHFKRLWGIDIELVVSGLMEKVRCNASSQRLSLTRR
jgi:hypothetical protein